MQKLIILGLIFINKQLTEQYSERGTCIWLCSQLTIIIQVCVQSLILTKTDFIQVNFSCGHTQPSKLSNKPVCHMKTDSYFDT